MESSDKEDSFSGFDTVLQIDPKVIESIPKILNQTLNSDNVLGIKSSGRRVSETEIELSGTQGNTALHFAVLRRSTAIAQEQLGLAFQANSLGKYPLLMACENGDSCMIDLLWKCSSPPQDYYNGCLHAAVQSGVSGMVEKIVKLAKDDELKKLAFSADNTGDYPIHIAARRGNLDALKLLLRKFPDLMFMVDKRRRNALHIAVEHKNEKISCYLLQQNGWEYLALAADNNRETFIDKAKTLDESALCKFVNALPRISKVENPAQTAVARKMEKMANKQQDRKRKQEISTSFTWLSVTAVLLATISYQGVLSVPGGADASGKPNLQDEKHFRCFVVLNTVALTLSVLVVIFLTLDMLLGLLSLERYLIGSKLRMKYLNVLISVGSVCIVASFAQALRALFADRNPVSNYYELWALLPLLFDFVIRVAFNSQRFREELGEPFTSLKDMLCFADSSILPLQAADGVASQLRPSSSRTVWRRIKSFMYTLPGLKSARKD